MLAGGISNPRVADQFLIDLMVVWRNTILSFSVGGCFAKSDDRVDWCTVVEVMKRDEQ